MIHGRSGIGHGLCATTLRIELSKSCATTRVLPFLDHLTAHTLSVLLRSQLREVVLHEFVALRLEADGDRTASHRKTRVALIVDPQRHLLAAAEKTTGVLRLGKRQLIVQRHAA